VVNIHVELNFLGMHHFVVAVVVVVVVVVMSPIINLIRHQ
jgi:hypothetical protein